MLPQLRLATGDALAQTGELLALPLYGGGVLDRRGEAAAAALGVDLRELLERDKAKGEPGEVHAFPTYGRLAARTLLLVGLGEPDELTPARLRKAGAAVARRATRVEEVTAAVAAGADAAGLQAFAEGLLLAAYSYGDQKSDPKPSSLARVAVVVDRAGAPREAALARARARSAATWLARDLANAPSLEKTPEWLAAQATRVAAPGLEVSVLTPPELAKQGFGGILAVGQGSTRSPRLIRLDYTPPARPRGRTPYVVLVGKGITFDSGGLSLKPNEGMAAMKTDMGGGAAVIAAMQALPALGLPVRVTGLVPTAENMPSGTAIRPGDVIRHYGGKTVEVLNTDAEGRLVLADALAFADAELAPDYLVDLATLTGAISVALGRKTAGYFSNDDRLAARIETAAEDAGERLWRMPLVEDYRGQIDSEVADLKNVGGDLGGGAITAALFLREFVGERRWAHLDIAGASRGDADDDENPKGATGYGVRTLLTWLASL